MPKNYSLPWTIQWLIAINLTMLAVYFTLFKPVGVMQVGVPFVIWFLGVAGILAYLSGGFPELAEKRLNRMGASQAFPGHASVDVLFDLAVAATFIGSGWTWTGIGYCLTMLSSAAFLREVDKAAAQREEDIKWEEEVSEYGPRYEGEESDE